MPPYAIVRHGGAGVLRMDIRGRLDFQVPKVDDGTVDPLSRVPVVVVDSLRFYLSRPAAR